jgi:hypothetical protein
VSILPSVGPSLRYTEETLVANDRSEAVHAFVSACRFRPDRDRLWVQMRAAVVACYRKM